ncbi:MAG TPA: hypothetical protein VFD06_05320 [Candidatus Polarisedimenticolia bacterium]|nr:hypothetical protein [Candidatus Polarisedimenticolia bacterium]
MNLPCVDDGNACTDEVCPQGSCTHPPKPDGTPCADRCHTCQGGVCSDTPVNCDDDNPCTDDPCDPTFGCLHTPRNCLDTNPCTFDICDASDGCRHLPAPAGDQCDDGIACTIQDSCVANSGGGMVCAGTVPGCDDGNPCTTDAGVVEGDSCSCRHTPVDDPCCSEGTPVSCDDGNACTVDACDGTNGDCRHDLLVCDDANACTHDVCEPQTGCVSRADPRDGQACDDLNACTRNDVCADGACGGTVLGDGEACDDSNVCTAEDQCYSGRCVGYGLEGGMPCDDGNSCTADDQCLYPENGDPECHGAARAIGASCDDGDLCTVNDRCFAAGAEGGAPACQGTGRDCADDDACTQDACDSSTGLCAHPPRSCEDGNSCTLDSCSTQTGECVHEPQDGTPCSEAGDRCHVGSCQGGACTGIAPVSCDDGNQCTFDFCDPASGCVHGGSGTFNPPPEICNGVDDDCDGKVDERELAPACEVRPRTMRDGRGQDSFTVTCRWNPACAGSPVPAPLDDIRPGWLSAADGLEEAGDDVVLPNPIAHCDTAIVEDDGKRTTSNAAVTFVFDPDGNGVCGTTGGGRAGLMQHLADVPDGELARICVRWRLAGPERCGVVLVRHETFTEQRRERRSKGQ